MKILLTGFETFGNFENNPTIALVKELQKMRKEDIDILILNVEYDIDGTTVINKMQEMNPDLVLSFGLAGGRTKVCFEAIALGIRNSTIPDNKGIICRNQRIESGALAYESTINYKDLEKNFSSKDFTISYHAGTFICNDVYFQELEHIEKNHLNTLCGFIHIPYTEPNNSIPYLPFSKVLEIVSDLMDFVIKNFTLVS